MNSHPHSQPIDHRAGYGASLLECIHTLQGVKNGLDYVSGHHDQLKPNVLNHFKGLDRAKIDNDITQGFIFAHNCIGEFVADRRPARDSGDYIERLNNSFERQYGALDDIESNGLTLGRVCILLAAIDRFKENAEDIKSCLESQEATNDMFEVDL